MRNRTAALIKLAFSMLIFGSIGLFVRYISLPSSIVAFVRAFIGVLFLLMIILLKRSKIQLSAVKRNFSYLLLSGAAVGLNWILLFESYRYTTVAVSTLCYYMAPIIVTVLAPAVLKEKLTFKRIMCVIVALVGMAFISGLIGNAVLSVGEMKGILLGFGAASLYASVILLNKKLDGISAIDRTIIQLSFAAIVVLPYCLLTCDVPSLTFTSGTVLLLMILGIVHTGIAYFLYFGSMEHLSGQSVAIVSYIDPVVAVLASITLLNEPFDIFSAIGSVLILGAAAVSELPHKGKD